MKTATTWLRGFLDRSATYAQIIPLYLGLVVAAFLGATTLMSRQDRTEARAREAVVRQELVLCLQRVDSREELIGAFHGLYDFFDSHGDPEYEDAIAALRADFATDFPPLSQEEC